VRHDSTHMEQVFVSEISYNKAKASFERMSALSNFNFVPVAEDEPTLSAAIRNEGVRAIIADIYPYTGELYDSLPTGGVIARYGVGHDSIDKDLASDAGIFVANTPSVLDNAVAEHAIWMIGSLSRHVHSAYKSITAGEWTPQQGVEVQGRKVAILGFGRIGQNLCRKLSIGLGMDVTGVDILSKDQFAEVNGDSFDILKKSVGFSNYTTDRAAALAEADYVVLLMAVVPATKHIANAEFFAQMKDSAVLINSARGALVNENDLFDALSNGSIAGAALDVFEVEPYQPQDSSKDLRTLSNLLLTPHVGSNTEESNAAMAERACRNVIEILENGPEACNNIVNRDQITAKT